MKKGKWALITGTIVVNHLEIESYERVRQRSGNLRKIHRTAFSRSSTPRDRPARCHLPAFAHYGGETPLIVLVSRSEILSPNASNISPLYQSRHCCTRTLANHCITQISTMLLTFLKFVRQSSKNSERIFAASFQCPVPSFPTHAFPSCLHRPSQTKGRESHSSTVTMRRSADGQSSSVSEDVNFHADVGISESVPPTGCSRNDANPHGPFIPDGAETSILGHKGKDYCEDVLKSVNLDHSSMGCLSALPAAQMASRACADASPAPSELRSLIRNSPFGRSNTDRTRRARLG
jgi:hypothetical protein